MGGAAMTLEPTDEQVAELAKRFEAETLVRAAAKAGLGYEDFVRILWPLVRDIVLEATEKEAVRLAFENAPEEREGSSLRVGGDRYFFVSGLSQLRTWILNAKGK